MREPHFNRILFWDRLILLLFCVVILSLVAPSYSKLFLARRYADGYKKTLAIILVSVNDCQYWLPHTVALRRPIPGFVKYENHTSIVSYFGTG